MAVVAGGRTVLGILLVVLARLRRRLVVAVIGLWFRGLLLLEGGGEVSVMMLMMGMHGSDWSL